MRPKGFNIRPELQVANHAFAASTANDFLCAYCGKPRAVHADDGFAALPDPPRNMDTNVRYRSAFHSRGERLDRPTQ
jgi:hypothetical protein